MPTLSRSAEGAALSINAVFTKRPEATKFCCCSLLIFFAPRTSSGSFHAAVAGVLASCKGEIAR